MTQLFRPASLLALVALIMVAPLLLVIAVGVRVSMGAPVTFRQLRSGRGGAPFKMVKFRSMTDLRDDQAKPLPDDERVTRLGRLLRRTRLDELPELVNIARGEMAFIGPRPLLPHTIGQMAVGGVERGAVRPGLTGLAQVSGNTLLSAEEKLQVDLWYVRNRSVALDAQILLRTIPVIVAGERRTKWYVAAPRRPRRRC